MGACIWDVRALFVQFSVMLVFCYVTTSGRPWVCCDTYLITAIQDDIALNASLTVLHCGSIQDFAELITSPR